MELRIYLGIIARRWWLILVVTIVVGLAAILYTFDQSKVYRGSASYILRPHSALTVDDSTVRAIDTLSRRIEIATTYAEVAGSDLIQGRAIQNLGLTPDDSTGLSVTGRVVPGTNVLELSFRGPDRDLLKQFAEAINVEFVAYVNGLYDVFELGILDQPRVARLPVGPDAKIVVGGAIVAGVVLGSILALSLQFWEIIMTDRNHLDILDPETGTFNHDYLMLRLTEELSRAKRNDGTFSLAILAVEYPQAAETWTPQYEADMLRRFIAFIGSQLREEDILCRYDRAKFALLLPVFTMGQARDLLAGVEESFGAGVAGLADEDSETLRFSAGIGSYADQESAEEIISQVEQALQKASDSEDSRITLSNGGREVIAAGA